MSVLLVCSGGGHLKQLNELLPRLPFPTGDRLWVTFDTGLSRSLMAEEEVLYARYAAPRDTVSILRNAALAAKVVKGRRFDHAVSTGSSLAVDFLPLAAMRGASCHFIETAARAVGPSMNRQDHGSDAGSPHLHAVPALGRRQLGLRGLRLRRLRARAAARLGGHRPPRRGDARHDGVLRLPSAARPARTTARRRRGALADRATDTSGLDIDARETVPHDELRKAISETDVVISHSGTGAAISTLEHGRCPILVPRLMRYHEHVDDHQVQIAAELAVRGLAVACPVPDLSPEVLLQAARRRTRPVADPPPLQLR